MNVFLTTRNGLKDVMPKNKSRTHEKQCLFALGSQLTIYKWGNSAGYYQELPAYQTLTKESIDHSQKVTKEPSQHLRLSKPRLPQLWSVFIVQQ